jgi:hypothetical protein
MGRNNSVGIATRYGLDGPGLNPGGGRFSSTVLTGLGGPPSLPYSGYWVITGGKAIGA